MRSRLAMQHITGAGGDVASNALQPRPGPQSYNNNKQQSITAKQTSTPRPPHPNPKRRPDGKNPRADTGGPVLQWDLRVTLISTTSPLTPFRPAIGVWLRPRSAAMFGSKTMMSDDTPKKETAVLPQTVTRI